MNLLGIGLDLVEIDRFRSILERSGEKFLERVFTAGERAYCLAAKDPAPSLAARFAAKEAVAKAFGTGIGEAMAMREIEVVRTESGAPEIRLHGTAAATAQARGVTQIWLSLTHTATTAAAQVVIGGNP